MLFQKNFLKQHVNYVGHVHLNLFSINKFKMNNFFLATIHHLMKQGRSGTIFSQNFI